MTGHEAFVAGFLAGAFVGVVAFWVACMSLGLFGGRQ
jgi:hypothetical protein